MMKTALIHVCLFGFCVMVAALTATAQDTLCVNTERRVVKLMNEIRQLHNDREALDKHLEVEEILAKALIAPQTYKYPFDSLKTIGRLYSPDRKFRMFNWNHALIDGTYLFFALIVIPTSPTSNTVIWLTDQSDKIERPEQAELPADKWFGALYYKIIPRHKGSNGEYFYTLLGSDLNNPSTKKRIIEILSFGKNGTTVKLGAPVIDMYGWTKCRVIFEFSAEETMYLAYNKRKRRIEFDHLAPPMPYMVGLYENYGPDERCDGLVFKRNHWKSRRFIKADKPKAKSNRYRPRRAIFGGRLRNFIK